MASSAGRKFSSNAASLFLDRGLPYVSKTADNIYGPVGKWILGTSGLVVGMIHVGGVTRLTQSGLSMTDWSPLGGLPPISKEEWEREFARYKTYPEWQQRQSMTLQDFQFIYGWEYGHRMLGRVVGLAFAMPWLYFTARQRIPPGYQKRMLGLFAMGGTQGLVGWWMVKSGLGDDRRDDKHEIRVRPVRLAAHLSMALATYGALVWTGLDLFSLPHSGHHGSHHLASAQTRLQAFVASQSQEALKVARRLRTGSLHLAALTAVTVASGALVAGNDAGRAFNTFPDMDGEWIPSSYMELTPWQRSLTEHTPTVQFNHRVLGSTTALGALSLAVYGLAPHRAAALTPQARKGIMALGAAATAQASLGVATLLTYVPFSLAATHQMGSIVVFTSALYAGHALRYARPALVKRLQQPGTAVSKGASEAASAAHRRRRPRDLA